MTCGSNNVSIGIGSLMSIVTGTNNTQVDITPEVLVIRLYNTFIGSNAGNSESSRKTILLMRRWTRNQCDPYGIAGTGNGQQNTCYIAGIEGVSVSN